MGKRLTENPFKLRFSVTEGGANTYAQVDIPVPLAVVGNKVQAIEIMDIYSNMDSPDPEAGQSNALKCQLVRDTQTALLNANNDQVIWEREIETRGIEVTAVGEIILGLENSRNTDMTDHDGNGEIQSERTLHMGILGTGNAAAKNIQGWLLVHLIELDGDEIAATQFLAGD